MDAAGKGIPARAFVRPSWKSPLDPMRSSALSAKMKPSATACPLMPPTSGTGQAYSAPTVWLIVGIRARC